MRKMVFLLSLFLSFSTFAQAGTISGRVTDALQEPIKGANVSFYLIQEESDSINAKLIESVRTDEHGNYEVKLDTGYYFINAKMPGFQRDLTWNFYLYREDKRTLDFSLHVIDIADYVPGGDPNNDIAGTIKSLSKEPISNATVIARNLDDFSDILQARSDSSGKFLLRNHRWGRYLVYAEKHGFNLSNFLMVRTPNAPQIEIILSATDGK